LLRIQPNNAWINDRHRIRASDGEPIDRPSYRVGDLLVIYLTGVGRCPAIARVVATAAFDPQRVDRGERPGDGKQWGWVTDIEMLGWTDFESAPTRDAIGVKGTSVQRHSRIRLSADRYQAAEHLIKTAAGFTEP
jgi:hypothetical protein